MTKKYILAVVALMLPMFTSAQELEAVHPKGDMLFNAGCYTKAIVEYKKAYLKKPDNTRLMRRLTEAILLDESPRAEATDYIDRYLQLDSTAVNDYEALYLAAQAHFYARNFSKARKHLENYQTMVTDKESQEKAEKLASWIDRAQVMLKDTLKNPVVNLGEMINTQYSELNPLLIDNKTLIFSSDDKYNSTEVLNYFNVKYSENKELGWTKSKAVNGMINTLYDEYVVGQGGGHVLFNSNRDVAFAIYHSSYLGNGRMSDGLRFEEPVDKPEDEVGATMSLNGDTLIYSATCENGKLDLFYSIRFNGKWCPPRPLPGQVNVLDSDESYPQLTPDGKRLYFSSDRPGSMGGMDIYYSDLDEKTGEWGAPVQMKYPINDMYDNYTISFSSDKRYGYISSIREGGFGGRDIYAIIYDEVMPTFALIKTTLLLKAKPKPINMNTIPFIEVTDETGEVVASVKMRTSNSTCIFTLEPGNYTLRIEAENIQPYTENLIIPEKVYDHQTPIEKIIVLEPAI